MKMDKQMVNDSFITKACLEDLKERKGLKQFFGFKDSIKLMVEAHNELFAANASEEDEVDEEA
jgi:hypothetical protein